MALSKLPSAAVDGITAMPVTVEVDVADGLPVFTVVGLADRAVEESRERIRASLKHSGYKLPLCRITVNLTPSNYKKTGIHFDLPIALSILIADQQITPPESLSSTLVFGALSLDGTVQAVPGMLILAEWAKSAGFKRIIVPTANFHEAALINGLETLPVKTLNETIDLLFDRVAVISPPAERHAGLNSFDDDWLQIQGQPQAKRAALVACAGGHNLLLEGPPGSGKTLLAKGMRALLPPPNHQELIEIVKLHSVAGQLPNNAAVDAIGRPFRSPHHTASAVSVVGGGRVSRPGEISLAHHGILFLDELPEFQRPVIEALRQPLEDGEIFVTRVEHSARYPANIMLVATMNPCPCGWFGSNKRECTCSAYEIGQYRKKISGPILDRIDLCLHMPFVEVDQLTANQRDQAELTSYRQQISTARSRARKRNGSSQLNAELTGGKVLKLSKLSPKAEALAKQAAEKLTLTGRGFHKLIKVARTIADLSDEEEIAPSAIAEALQYRFTDA